MKAATVEVWAWVLIYGGLLLVCLALFVGRNDLELGWAVGSTGGGLLLIYLRSRMHG